MEKIELITNKTCNLIDFILSECPKLNYSIIKTALRKKDIKVDGMKVKDDQLLNANSKITIYLASKREKTIRVVYEDENVLLAFKPAGIETTTKDKAFLDSESLEELTHAKACHRLDKNTEGIVALAKNEASEKCLTDAFKAHNIKKEYIAIVCGKINKNGENFEDFVKKEQNFVKICLKNDKNGKIAKLSYKLIKTKNDLSELNISLETGRTHQIRVQLSHHGIFVLGDEKYGDKTFNKIYHKKKQLLCATKITFENIEKPLDYLNGKSFEVKPTFDLEKL